jgi:DNA-binding response OmpR family regulator
MPESQNIRSGKRKYIYGLILLSFIAVICVAFSISTNDDFDFARREVVLRRIGHEILLQSGDSTSRLLPVKKLHKNEYQVNFESDFSFKPDLLVNTTQRLLGKEPFANDYVVNVLNCTDASVAYAYAISKNKKDDIVACIGRTQPHGCYRINIKFKPAGITTAKNVYFFGVLLLLAFAAFIFLKPVTPQSVLPSNKNISNTSLHTLGSVIFDAKNRKLTKNENTIDLTATETRLLSIFACCPNETIERSRLQKEIWEDEGVIVGRSLDMFISKLRKKLEIDPNIKIVVIRSKGYKLEIGG